MNHFMLLAAAKVLAAGSGRPLRFFELESLIDEFIKHGSQRRDLKATVFGAVRGGRHPATVTELGGSAPRRVHTTWAIGRN
jgi:chemotaxis receptor (MCP) glutamine deamidase CheD